MAYQNDTTGDELDLRELFAALWAEKIIIGFVFALSVFLGIYYILNTDKKFTATVIFQIEQHEKSGFNLPSELGSLASLAGFGEMASSNPLDILLERIDAREFILDFSRKTFMISDQFYNTIDLGPKASPWKDYLKDLLGIKPTIAEKNAIIEKEIITNYQKYTYAETTDSGAMSISVTHENPNSAAKYANSLMEEIRQLVERESEQEKAIRLSYLSKTLADALQDMDDAQEKLKDYALENSALAQENFISDSLKLDELRMEKRKVDEIENVLSVLDELITTRNFDKDSYEALRSTYPLVDDVDFRRILGMSEVISAWSWPNLETVKIVSATLRDRIKRLNVEIKNIEDSAKIYATSAENLVKFTRNAKIAEATYTVIIEQVKSQSLAAGFQPETFTVFEYAAPPLKPSSPKTSLVLVLSAVLGLLLGFSIALINSARRGVYYTKTALVADTHPKVVLKSRSFTRLTRWSISRMDTLVSKRKILEVDEAEAELAAKKLIYIVNCGGKPTPSGTARLLALQSSKSGRKVVIWDKTSQPKLDLEQNYIKDSSDFNILKLENDIDLMKETSNDSSFSSKNFNSHLEKLLNNYDQVFICSNNRDSIIGLLALKQFKPCLVLLGRLRNTRKEYIKKIRANQPVDILFYE